MMAGVIGSISFLVPAFNEEHSIALTVANILDAVGNQDCDYEVILINDASRDRTGEMIDMLAAHNSRIIAVHNSKNLNMGGAYKRGLHLATKEFVMMVPGDNGFGKNTLRHILASIGTADIIIPYVTNNEIRTPFRAIASRIFSSLINCLFGLAVKYYNGPVVHRTDLLKTISIRTNGFAYQAEALVRMLSRGCSYQECAVQIQPRAGGRSAALKIKNQISVMMTVLNLLYTVGPRQMFVKRKMSMNL